MKKILIIFMILSTFFTLKSTAQDTLVETPSTYENSIGLSVSHLITGIMGGELSVLNYSFLYKKYNEKFNFRAELIVSPEINTKNFYFAYNNDGTKTRTRILDEGEIIFKNDSLSLERVNLYENIMGEFNLGFEKLIKARNFYWLVGVGANIGFYSVNESYTYKLNDLNAAETTYSEIEFLTPNTAKPYYKAQFIKAGLVLNAGFEYNITQRFNISGTFTPNLYTLIEINSDYSDNENYILPVEKNRIEFNQGFLNISISYKF